MNINKLLTITALTSLLGLSSFIGIREKESILVKGDEAPSQKIITVDPNQKWGNGTETYKVATCFYDDDSHKGWSELVTIETPKTYIEMSYEVDFTPTSLVVYRYNKDFSKENWLTDPTGENYQDYGWTSSPVLNKTYPISYENNQSKNIINVILENESYGHNELPYVTHQNYLPDQQTWESNTLYLNDIKENGSKHTEYSVTIELKDKDLVLFEKYFENVVETDITFANNVAATDFEYWKSELSSGLEYKGDKQTYSLHLDYKDHKILINKILNPTPEPTPEPAKKNVAYIYIAVAFSVVAAAGIGFGVTMLIRKRHKKI